jgi:glycosyltransferase involved in cell wall biosynthesis
MRILLTCDVIEGAGITTYCENLADGLNDAGHEVILLAGSTSHYPSEKYRPTKAFRKCVFLKRGVSTAKSHLKKYIKSIKDLNPDVLIINNSPFVMASLPYIPWHIIRIPVIHNIRETEVRPFLALHFWWDRAVCVSPFIARVAKGLPGSAKLYVCPLGIKVYTANTRIYNAGTKSEPLSMVWAGRVDKDQKRADLIPQIAHELEIKKISYRWTVLGDGKDLGTVTKTLTDMGIKNKFRFMGLVPRQHVLETFREADVLVMPSDYEGLPQALLESMNMGVVPVVSRIPGSTDYIIRDGEEGFLCERGKPESFAQKISELEQNRILLFRMSEAAIERVKSHFSHHAFAERIIQNISDTVKEGITRVTPLPLGTMNTKIPEMKGRSCSGLLWSMGIIVKWGILKRLRRNS